MDNSYCPSAKNRFSGINENISYQVGCFKPYNKASLKRKKQGGCLQNNLPAYHKRNCELFFIQKQTQFQQKIWDSVVELNRGQEKTSFGTRT